VTPLRQRMQEDLQIRRYSPVTIRIYLHAMAEFARHFGKAPDRLGAEQIRQYQLFLIKEKKVSRPTFIQMVCALRFFYTHTLSRKIPMERIPFPRRERKLPLILSREEVQALLQAPSDLRHRTLLAILYGCGLRVSELTDATDETNPMPCSSPSPGPPAGAKSSTTSSASLAWKASDSNAFPVEPKLAGR